MAAANRKTMDKAERIAYDAGYNDQSMSVDLTKFTRHQADVLEEQYREGIHSARSDGVDVGGPSDFVRIPEQLRRGTRRELAERSSRREVWRNPDTDVAMHAHPHKYNHHGSHGGQLPCDAACRAGRRSHIHSRGSRAHRTMRDRRRR